MDTYIGGRERPRWRRPLRVAAALSGATLLLAGCGGIDEPRATFDGRDCTYEGPTEFDLGSEQTFTFTHSTDETDIGFAVWTVPNGTTTADISALGIFGIDGAEMRELKRTPSSPDTEYELTVALDSAGSWAVNCFAASGDVEGDYPATVFMVTDN